MKKYLALLLALVMCLSLAACGASAPKEAAPTQAPEAPAEEATQAPAEAPEAPAEEAAQAPAEAPFNDQKIRIGDNVYDRMLRALMEQTESEITVVLESDVLMTGSAIILGTSDYGGMFQGNTVTVTPTSITIDLNGFSITGEEGMPIFEVQSGYTLTIVDHSEAQTGKLITRGETEVAVEGGTYHPLGE